MHQELLREFEEYRAVRGSYTAEERKVLRNSWRETLKKLNEEGMVKISV